jgi:hypothetical protein
METGKGWSRALAETLTRSAEECRRQWGLHLILRHTRDLNTRAGAEEMASHLLLNSPSKRQCSHSDSSPVRTDNQNLLDGTGGVRPHCRTFVQEILAGVFGSMLQRSPV